MTTPEQTYNYKL